MPASVRCETSHLFSDPPVLTGGRSNLWSLATSDRWVATRIFLRVSGSIFSAAAKRVAGLQCPRHAGPIGAWGSRRIRVPQQKIAAKFRVGG